MDLQLIFTYKINPFNISTYIGKICCFHEKLLKTGKNFTRTYFFCSEA